MKYVAPQSGLKAFTCPHCGVYAQQTHRVSTEELAGKHYGDFARNPVRVSECAHCQKICLWFFEALVYPSRGNAPQPNPDMPAEAIALYEEAAAISTLSPRGAAALLRLTIQRLVIALGGSGSNLNEDIAALAKRGLPERVQRALDVVRVIGNNAVHPGQIDVDNADTVSRLFELTNVIAEYMVTLPDRVDNLYESLPEAARKAIDKRDKS